MQLAIVAEEGFHRAGAIEAALDRQRRASKALQPTRKALQAAVAAREPVTVVGRAHWPPGWLHHLGIGDGGRPVQEASPVDELRDVLVTEIGTLADLLGPDRHLTKARVTAAVTASIVEWARGKRTSGTAGWTAYRELSLPVAPVGSTRFGRLDVTVMRPDGPDLVVEIDSAHSEGNLGKLVFARDAGAIAVWVRWHGGRIEQPAGVSVIDLIGATRGLAT